LEYVHHLQRWNSRVWPTGIEWVDNVIKWILNWCAGIVLCFRGKAFSYYLRFIIKSYKVVHNNYYQTFLWKVECWLANSHLIIINEWGKQNFDWLTVKEFCYISLHETLRFYPTLHLQYPYSDHLFKKIAHNCSLYHLCQMPKMWTQL
jgi:hypothetical protein